MSLRKHFYPTAMSNRDSDDEEKENLPLGAQGWVGVADKVKSSDTRCTPCELCGRRREDGWQLGPKPVPFRDDAHLTTFCVASGRSHCLCGECIGIFFRISQRFGRCCICSEMESRMLYGSKEIVRDAITFPTLSPSPQERLHRSPDHTTPSNPSKGITGTRVHGRWYNPYKRPPGLSHILQPLRTPVYPIGSPRSIDRMAQDDGLMQSRAGRVIMNDDPVRRRYSL